MLDLYKKRMAATGSYMGEALKKQSDQIMDATFTRDIAYRKCYIDGNAVDAKYVVHTYYSISGDAVDYHIQFRPGVHYPIGTYIDIPDDIGEYHRWLLINRSDEPQFPKYNALKCNWTFKWIDNGVIHEVLGVLRSRNNYNSGLWHNYLTTSVENQTRLIVPYNDVTKTLQYRKRMLISVNQDNPIAWEVSKVEDTYPPGVIYVTMTQDMFDPVKDNKELMVADYYETPVEPLKDKDSVDIITQIKYSGQPQVKVGGGYKTFSYEVVDNVYTWRVSGLEENQYTIIQQNNKLKIKVVNDYSLVGSVITLSLLDKDNAVVSTLEVGVVSL